MWILTRNDNDENVAFPTDMQWVDEFSWSKVAQGNPVRSITGKMFVPQGIKTGGRPITLSGDWVWHRRSDLELLRSWCDVAKLTMTLQHPDGRKFNVMWRLHDVSTIDAAPVDYIAPEDKGDPYTAIFKLMEI